jgi:hypothetical protein
MVQRTIVAAMGLLIASGSGACFFTLDCAEDETCAPGSGGGTPQGCDPSKTSKAVANTCGVFVSPSGSDGNAGTKEKPLKSFKAALAKGTTIYACAGATAYSEAVTIGKQATIFGALDCAKGWVYDGSRKTQLTANADAVPLTLGAGPAGAEVVDFAITAPDATQDGGSSVAVVVDGGAASFTRTDVTAGKGKDGLPGTTPTETAGPTDPNDAAIKGNDGTNACASMTSELGGDAKENALCPAASGGPLGGAGGVGAVNSGSNGDVQPTANAQTALGGVGQPNMDPMSLWACVAGSGLGASGLNGGLGPAGVGATSAALGTIDKTGYTGAVGQAGGTGKPGQGGGGGGGAKGKSMCAGASGGGGGAGGCGGRGGTAGRPGGASIGLVSLGATLAFETVTIKTGAGGNGGAGGDGEIGGSGGKGGSGGVGSGTLNACDGGNGGQGGQGGKGGGGRGGHAIGIAWTGTTMPATSGVTFKNKGIAGMGGKGDDAMGNPGDGATGVAADTQVFQ